MNRPQKPNRVPDKNKTNWGKEIAHSGKFAGTVAGKVFSYILNILLTLLLIGLITGTIVGGAFIIYIKNYIDPSIDQLELLTSTQNMTSKIYYMNYSDRENRIGVPVEMEDQRIYGSENRLWVGYNEMPTYLVEAFVSIEDERYWEHSGVDWLRTIRVTLDFFMPGGKKQGGSTITQQLIKNVTKEDDNTIQRKVQEILRALNLNKAKSKEEILEMYLNTIYLSQHSYGVQAAANTYFNKDVSELSLIECAAIASIPQAPTKWDPAQNPDRNKTRRNEVLKKMLELGKITQQEFDSAYDKELTLDMNTESTGSAKATNSWYVDQVIDDVSHALMEQKGISNEIAIRMIYSSGLQIYTCMDPEVQAVMDEVYIDAEEKYFPPEKSIIKPESAMVIIDPHTGDILGLVGGRGEKKGDRIWNRATDSQRQPGSSIKPLTVYGPAMDKGLITTGTVFDDAPVNFISDTRAWPKNYPLGYRGLTTVSSALERSVNTIAVRILQKLTVQESFNFGKYKLHMDSLIESKKMANGKTITDMDIATLGLGALSYGVTVEEITAGYTIFANKGVYCHPRTFIKVLDSEGNVLINNDTPGEIVISEQTASIMTKLMQNVVQSGTAKSITLKKYIDVAGKTGTTDADKDRWFIGYTPYYIGGVWFGYDQPKVLSTRYESNPPNMIWDEIMTKLHQKYLDAAQAGTPLKKFEMANGIITATYCKDSGKLMTEACKLDPRGSRAETGYFTQATAPSKPCDVHVIVDYDKVTGAVAGSGCPKENLTKVALIRNTTRNFPVQVSIEDAQYVYRDLPNGVSPGGWWGVPFFANTIPEGTFIGTTNVEKVFNRFCYEHENLAVTTEETTEVSEDTTVSSGEETTTEDTTIEPEDIIPPEEEPVPPDEETTEEETTKKQPENTFPPLG